MMQSDPVLTSLQDRAPLAQQLHKDVAPHLIGDTKIREPGSDLIGAGSPELALAATELEADPKLTAG